MTLNDAYLTLGRTITDMANAGRIDADRREYYRRAGAARALLRAAAGLDAGGEDKALRLGRHLSTPLPGGKDWRPVAVLAYRLGKQVARAQQTAQLNSLGKVA